MTWGMVGAAVVTVGVGAYSSSQAQRGQVSNMNSQMMADGRSAAAQNLAMSARNAYMVGLANMQLGLTKRQLAQQGADVRTAGMQARGQLEATAAASGTMGASVDAARTDVQSKVDQAIQSNKDEWENTLENYNNDLESMKLNALNAVIQPRQNTYKGTSVLDNIIGSALSTAVSFGSNYALQSMRLNLGSTVKTPGGGSSLFPADYRTNIPQLNYLS